jgi:hypothetical protein
MRANRGGSSSEAAAILSRRSNALQLPAASKNCISLFLFMYLAHR